MKNDNHCTNLTEALSICARCGYCRDACPAYAAGGWESFSPRGKFSIIDAMNKTGEVSDVLAKRAFQCTMCGACREACITGLDPRSMWFDLRKQLADQKKAPDVMYMLQDMVNSKGNIAGEDGQNRLLWAENNDAVPKNIDEKQHREVLYFIGCLSSLYPAAYAVAQAVALILTKAGVSFTTMGKNEICCGFPLMAGGLAGNMAELAQQNIATIERLAPQKMVATCPGCLDTWTHEYPKLLGRELPVPMLHISQLLLELVQEGRLKFKPADKVITYHDPCDLGRNYGIFDEPRDLIRAVPGVTLVEMEKNRENSLCCGGGGNLEMADKELAEGINALKIAMIQDTGASLVVTSCQQCRRSLTAAMRKAKLRIKVMEISEFLLSSLADED